MSRAFVKEPDGDEFADELPERPQHPIPNYVTPAGFAALEAQREALIERRDELSGEDHNLLDKEHLKHVERDLRYVDGRLAHAVLVDPAAQDPEEVAFGAIVEVVSRELRTSGIKFEELRLEHGRLDDVFRQITMPVQERH